MREPKSPGERVRVTGLRGRSKGFQVINTWPLRRKEGYIVSPGTHYLSEKDIFPLLPILQAFFSLSGKNTFVKMPCLWHQCTHSIMGCNESHQN